MEVYTTKEAKYISHDQRTQILLRPAMYIGNIEKKIYPTYIYDKKINKFVIKDIEYSEGFKRLFDEIITNATDYYLKKKSVKNIWVEVTDEYISVKNDNNGIEIIKTGNIYLPQRIYTVLNTSSNYDDNNEERKGSGMNGLGAKLTGLFSKKIIIDIVDNKKGYLQICEDGLGKIYDPEIDENVDDESYTFYQYYPKLEVFGMKKIDENAKDLILKRCYDVIPVTNGMVNIYFNGNKLGEFMKNPVIDYFKMYISSDEQYIDINTKKKDKITIKNDIITISKSEQWKIYALPFENHNISLINGIDLRENGVHMDFIHKSIRNYIDKKIGIGSIRITNLYSIFVIGNIPNPDLNGQNKTKLNNLNKNLLPYIEDYPIDLLLENGLKSMIETKLNVMKKLSIKGKEKIAIEAKHIKAKKYGKKNNGCYLIITEGDSAKSSFVSVIGSFGPDMKDRIGIFPIKGKFLNVDLSNELTSIDNSEIKALINIIGLDINNTYETQNDINELKYSGGIIIASDQDPDGSHIKGLVAYFFHKYFPGLVKSNNYLYEFTTPLIKAIPHKKNINEEWFYTEREYQKWKSSQQNIDKKYLIKYYKGLGSSSNSEFNEYIKKYKKLIVGFKYTGNISDNMMKLVFSKEKDAPYERKIWLMENYSENLEPNYETNTNKNSIAERTITYEEFINTEFIHFAFYDNTRTIPGIDGFKPSQRKAIYCLTKEPDNVRLKVNQFGNKVAEKTKYHHGEDSLIKTIQGLCKNYIGSNNLPMIYGDGQFGNRTGHKPAAGRYTSIKKQPYFHYIFRKEDDPILEKKYDEEEEIEPKFMLPIIPPALINPITGIGVGISSEFVPYKVEDVIDNIRTYLNENVFDLMEPYYNGFVGDIELDENNEKVLFMGKIEEVKQYDYIITELPPMIELDKYKERILNKYPESKYCDPVITNPDNHPQKQGIEIKIKLNSKSIKNNNIDLLLDKSKSLKGINIINEDNKLVEYNNIYEYFEDYIKLRLKYYDIRKNYLIEKYKNDMKIISNKIYFIEKLSDKKNNLIDKSKKEIYEMIKDKIENPEKCDYLFDMKMSAITSKNIKKLKDEYENIKNKLNKLYNKNNKEMWIEELNELEKMLIIA